MLVPRHLMYCPKVSKSIKRYFSKIQPYPIGCRARKQAYMNMTIRGAVRWHNKSSCSSGREGYPWSGCQTGEDMRRRFLNGN